MTIFVVTIPIFPAHTVFTDEMRLADRLHAMALPAATLAIAGLAPVLRVSRACLISVLASDYIEMAKLKGISITRIITIHALLQCPAAHHQYGGVAYRQLHGCRVYC